MSEFSKLTTKKARVAYIRSKLSTDLTWALRGLVKVYEAQTEDEKAQGATVLNNGVGFTGTDAEFLTPLAQKYIRYGTLSDRQLGFVTKLMPKYAAQLERVAPPYTSSPSPEGECAG